MEEDIIRTAARSAVDRASVINIKLNADSFVKELVEASQRFHKNAAKKLFYSEVITSLLQAITEHQAMCKYGPNCPYEQKYHEIIYYVRQELESIEGEATAITPVAVPLALTHLHPTVQKVAGSRFVSGHYSDAIQKACTALEQAVQIKSGQPAGTTGASVMTTAFSKNSPLIRLAIDPNEQFGFMALYQGAVMALRNHFAHSLTELTDTARALEWLGFFSALFYMLDEAQYMVASPTP